MGETANLSTATTTIQNWFPITTYNEIDKNSRKEHLSENTILVRKAR